MYKVVHNKKSGAHAKENATLGCDATPRHDSGIILTNTLKTQAETSSETSHFLQNTAEFLQTFSEFLQTNTAEFLETLWRPESRIQLRNQADVLWQFST